MSIARRCPHCDSEMSGTLPDGLCPACLLIVGLTPAPATTPSPVARSLPHIEGYHLLEEIGAGGMGVVYKAEQQRPITRLVAIKLIKLGMDTRELIARFEGERQALAQLNHPNVAAVYHADATHNGRPFFVMEYVPGEPITAFSDRHRYTTRQRLELFTQACDGIQHAHQKAIIHRDIKPSNLLVMLENGRPLVKVIDFGVAKATAQRLTEQTMFTAHGQLIGTPEYMSPEQTETNALDVDTRSDIYSLGVVLYELLSGALPFDPQTLRDAAFGEIQRIVREVDPPRPSTRFAAAEGAATIAARRQTDAAALSRELRRELEWIPLKAMRKDRSHRYSAASELANDVQNYLSGLPLIAAPESKRYRIRKFVRRNKGRVVIAAAVGLLIATSIAVSTWQAVRLKAEQERTLAQKQEADRKGEQARQNERMAEERLHAGLIATGDSYLASRQAFKARESFSAAWDLAERLQLSPLPATTGLMESYEIGSPPLMGSEREGGIQGFKDDIDGLNCAVISPDGRSVVTTSFQRPMRLWDLRTGQLIRGFGDSNTVQDASREAAFSRDGRTVLEARGDQTARLWDVQSGKLLRVFSGHLGQVRCAAFAPDGHTAVTGGGQSDGTAKLWDVESGRLLHTLKTRAATVHGVAFTPDGHAIVTVGEHPNFIKVWDVETGSELRSFGDGTGADHSVAISPDGRLAMIGSHDGTIKLWNLESGERIYSKLAHRGSVNEVRISADGRCALSGGNDGVLLLLELESGRELNSITQGERIWGVAFSPDGAKIVGAGSGGRIIVCSAVQNHDGTSFAAQLGRASSVAISSDGRVALSATLEAKSVTLWDVATSKVLRRLSSDSNLWSVAMSPACLQGAGSHEDGKVLVWDLVSGKLIHSLKAHSGVATAVAFSPDGRNLLSAGSDKTVKLWDVETGSLLRTFSGHTDKVRGVAFSPDGRIAASAAFDKSIILWDVATGKPVRTLTGHSYWVHCVSFSPDGRTLASGGWDSESALWDVQTGRRLHLFSGHTHIVVAVAFSPDGRQLLTGSFDGSMKLLDVERWVELRTFRRDEGAMRNVLYLPGGHGALSSTDLAVRHWEWDRPQRYRDFERELPTARATLKRNANDASALATFGEWYVFRGVHDWAAEFFEQARNNGGEVSSLALARCYWQMGKLLEAEHEFRLARDRGEARTDYLDLCLDAVKHDTSLNAPTTASTAAAPTLNPPGK